jgi:hypothetical protein
VPFQAAELGRQDTYRRAIMAIADMGAAVQVTLTFAGGRLRGMTQIPCP